MKKLPFLDVKQRAESREPFAQVLYGFLIEHGLRMAPDREVAKDWYERAAKQGFAPGQYALAFSFDQDNTDKSIYWLEQAAQSDYAPAQFALGCIYQEGEIVEQDLVCALNWIKASADQDFMPALNHLSFLYEEGIGVNKDLERALGLVRRSAELGDSDAAYLLGTKLVEKGGKKLNSEGLGWIWAAASTMHPFACMFLSRMFGAGLYGAEKNENLSRFFLQKSKMRDADRY